MIWYQITGPNTLTQHTDLPAQEIQFDLSGTTWTKTVLPNGNPITVADSIVIADLNLRLTQLRPSLPLVPGFLFRNGVYRGPTALPQFSL